MQIKTISKENHTIGVFLNLTINYTLYKLILQIMLTELFKLYQVFMMQIYRAIKSLRTCK